MSPRTIRATDGFATGQSFVFDLTKPEKPRIAARFADAEGYSHPHSFLRLPNGNVLATFQMRHDHDSGAVRAGGLVEMTPDAQPARSRSADGPAGNEGLLTAEPRLLADGRTLLVSTFNCGLYLVGGIDGDAPSARRRFQGHSAWRSVRRSLTRPPPLFQGSKANP